MGGKIRLAIGAAVLIVIAGRSTWRVAQGRLTTFLLVGALFSSVPFTLIAIATVTLPAGFTALLNAATPLFTAAIAVAFMGQRVLAEGRGQPGRRCRGGHPARRLVAARPGATTALAVTAGLGAPASYAVAGNLVRARLSDVPPMSSRPAC